MIAADYVTTACSRSKRSRYHFPISNSLSIASNMSGCSTSFEYLGLSITFLLRLQWTVRSYVVVIIRVLRHIIMHTTHDIIGIVHILS